MLRHLHGLFILMALLVFAPQTVLGAAFEVTNIKVSIQSENAVKARDEAIGKAQRIGLATLTNRDPASLSGVTDAQISRLVRARPQAPAGQGGETAARPGMGQGHVDHG